MQKELLPPNLIIENLEDRLEKLKHIVAQKKKQQNNEMPQGHLHIAQISKTPQYYHCTDPKDFNGKYIPSSQKKFINQLAQKDYDIKVIKLLEKEIEVTQKYLSNVATNEDTINNESYIQTKLLRLYTNLTPARQQLITPVTLTDEQYVEQWQSVSWQGRPFAQDEHYLLTNRNEKVRSKSEVLIANALAKHGPKQDLSRTQSYNHNGDSNRTAHTAICGHYDKGIFLFINAVTGTRGFCFKNVYGKKNGFFFTRYIGKVYPLPRKFGNYTIVNIFCNALCTWILIKNRQVI